MAMDYFRLLFRHFTGETEKKHENTTRAIGNPTEAGIGQVANTSLNQL
jgi:hypothetical protein